jgi:hypothetical protein
MLERLDPVFQVYVEAPPAVKVVDCPEQIVKLPSNVTVGFGFTVKFRLAVFEQVPEEPIIL